MVRHHFSAARQQARGPIAENSAWKSGSARRVLSSRAFPVGNSGLSRVCKDPSPAAVR
jgi:hypothetical protein